MTLLNYGVDPHSKDYIRQLKTIKESIILMENKHGTSYFSKIHINTYHIKIHINMYTHTHINVYMYNVYICIYV